MRKKFFAMYALVGALVASPVFTSCIDDTESASVTAVRTQKAEAMRIANQIAAANAELQIQRDKLALEKDIASYEQNIAYYESLLLQYQLDIKENQKELDNFGVKTLSDLTSAYTTALSNVATTEWNIVKYNQQIASLNAGYTDALEALKDQIAESNKQITQKQTKIAELKKLQENGVDEIALNATKKELKAISDKAFKAYKELKLQYGIDETYINQSNYNITWAKNLAVIKAIDFFNTLSLTVYTTDKNDLYVLDNSNVLIQQRTFAQNAETYKKSLDDAIAALGTEKDTEKTTISVENDNLTAYAELVRTTKQMEAADALLAKLEKALADAKAALEADEDDADLIQDVTDAQTALTNFKNDATKTTYNHDGDEEGVKDAGYQFAKDELSTAEMGLANAKDNVIVYERDLAQVSETSTQFEEYLKAFEGEAYEAYKTAVAELDAAKEAYDLAAEEYATITNLYANLNTTGSGVWENNEELTFEEAIAKLEGEIEDINAEIKELGASFGQFEDDVLYQDPNNNNYWYINRVTVDSEEVLAGTVAYLEKKIAIEETKLAAYNKMAEEAKAALDAYLAE